MSGPAKKVKFKLAWQTYMVGDEIEPNGTLRDWLVGNGYADIIETESPSRPAKMAHKAAKKIADGAKSLFGQQG